MHSDYLLDDCTNISSLYSGAMKYSYFDSDSEVKHLKMKVSRLLCEQFIKIPTVVYGLFY